MKVKIKLKSKTARKIFKHLVGTGIDKKSAYIAAMSYDENTEIVSSKRYKKRLNKEAYSSLTCPNCGGLMEIVSLYKDNLKVKYCKRDKVVLPLRVI